MAQRAVSGDRRLGIKFRARTIRWRGSMAKQLYEDAEHIEDENENWLLTPEAGRLGSTPRSLKWKRR